MKIKYYCFTASLLFWLALLPTVSRGQGVVRGSVRDGSGQPVAGVSVVIEGSAGGVISDASGNYSINVPGENAVLKFSLLGYAGQDIPVSGRTTINVVLEEEATGIDEVVVVGYGVQKKINLSGAVQAVSGSDALASRPIPNIASGLQGMVSNLNITTGSGRADDAPVINIRGYTSINDSSGEAFVLVDNMPVSREELSRINPNDIESVSVLKDASSAAIYGARAAFGVVLITTKSAKSGRLNINFSGNYALRDRGISPEYVTDPELVMNMKAAARYPLSALYTPQQLEYATRITANPSIDRVIVNPSNPNQWQYYGETDWFAETHTGTASTYTASLDISQKTDKFSYYVSGGYYNQEGLLRYGNDNLDRYNVRSRADVNLTPWWNLGANLSYTHIDYDSPTMLDGYFYWQVNRMSSLDMPRNPDGTWTSTGAGIMGALDSGGRRIDGTNESQVSFTSKWNLAGDVWTLNADVNFRRTGKTRDQSNLSVPYRTGPDQPILQHFGERGGADNNSVNNISFANRDDRYNVCNIYTNFAKTFAGRHFLGAMVGYNRETQSAYYNKTLKTGLITTSLPELNLSTGTTTTTNTRRELALEGVFGRLNYIYDNRYIVELNGRYDGSSRFPRTGRYGFFPSTSVAWVLANEKFFSGAKDALRISNLKLRGSYGALGNQNVSDYYPAIPYMSSSTTSYILDGSQPLVMDQPGVVSPTLTWEKVRTVNLGVDFGLWNKLDASFDAYTRYTDDMLTQSKELPGVFGATPPRTNAADLKTRGWELSLSWRDRFTAGGSPFNWSVKFMLSDSRSFITRYDNPTFNFGKNGNSFYEGKEIGELWGFITDGYFRTQAEVDALNQRDIGSDDVGYAFQVGDIRMTDLDGDGRIGFGDNTLADPGDRKIIGNTSVRFPYSFELAADWKGFDVRAFFQGVGRHHWYPTGSSIYFWGIYAQPWTNVTKKNLDHWTEDNPGAYFPRIKAYAAEDNDMELAAAQTKYLQNAAYLRLKNLTVGYSLPQSVLNRLHISYLRIYFSAENLFTISGLDKGIQLDPEIIERYNGFNSGAYPMQRRYSIGLDLTF